MVNFHTFDISDHLILNFDWSMTCNPSAWGRRWKFGLTRSLPCDAPFNKLVFIFYHHFSYLDCSHDRLCSNITTSVELTPIRNYISELNLVHHSKRVFKLKLNFPKFIVNSDHVIKDKKQDVTIGGNPKDPLCQSTFCVLKEVIV